MISKDITLRHIKHGIVLILCLLLCVTAVPMTAQAAARRQINKTKITLSYTEKTYAGKELHPKVTVKYGKTILKKNRDYTVTYKNNEEIGTATVTVKGKGKYAGKKTAHFKILPKGTNITELSAGTNYVLVHWDVSDDDAMGYQIQYSPDRSFQTGKKTKTLMGNVIGHWEISGIKPDATYYFRIRTVVQKNGNGNGKRYVSKWSKVKAVKTLPETAADLSGIAKANAQIALRTLRDRMAGNEDKNMLFSPFSLYEDLAMAANGSGGNTRAELEKYLQNDIDTINAKVEQYNAILPPSVKVANSIWLNEIYGDLNTDFQQMTEQRYDALIRSVPYNMETVDEINGWVKEKTDDMIPALLDRLDSSEVMHLINAISFESEWGVPYGSQDIEEGRIFTNSRGQEETCTMLTGEENEYIDLNNANGHVIARGFVKPYKDGKTAFLALLPKEGHSIESVLRRLNGNRFVSMFNNRRTYTNGTLYAEMPEFTVDDEIDLNSYLQNAGVRDAFDPATADFYGMLAAADAPLYIDTVTQKTHIEVDRYGTRAAAVTDIGVKCGSVLINKQDMYITLDRPFIYAIVDVESGVPYFIGVQETVAQ